MKKAFTLIELLVVIAIIAILAAILFPVFAQAKLAAKKSAGLTQAKQIGTSMHMYLADYDDTFFAYRFNGGTGSACSGAPCVNTDYQKVRAASGQAFADQMFSARSRDVMFHKQLLDPYIKNDQIWLGPNKPGAWSGYDAQNLDTEPQFRSYGGQNSYGLNNYMFSPAVGTTIPANTMSSTMVEEPSNTYVMIDSSYYNVIARSGPGSATPCMLNGGTGWDPNTSTYPRYWKNLGNSYLFRWVNGAASEPSTAEAESLIQARYSGVLNTVRADSSAKSVPWKKVVDDGPSQTYKSSPWDPYKTGCL